MKHKITYARGQTKMDSYLKKVNTIVSYCEYMRMHTYSGCNDCILRGNNGICNIHLDIRLPQEDIINNYYEKIMWKYNEENS